MDTHDLKPGTKDWEEAIEAAIKQSSLVVLLASPHSKRSTYVAGELALADELGLVIVPVWIAGEAWQESIPAHMATTQYLDCRPLQGKKTLEQASVVIQGLLADQMPKHFALQLTVEDTEQERTYYSLHQYEKAYGDLAIYIVILDSHQLLVFNSSRYETMSSLANDLYMNYLSDRGSTVLVRKRLVASGSGLSTSGNSVGVAAHQHTLVDAAPVRLRTVDCSNDGHRL